MESNDRPRTKRLERPTPNLRHPIIGTKKSKDANCRMKECTEGFAYKCKTSANNVIINMDDEESVERPMFDKNDHLFNIRAKREPPAQQKLNITVKNVKDKVDGGSESFNVSSRSGSDKVQ